MEYVFGLIRHATISLPVIEIAILVVALSVFLVLRLTRVGLVAAYLFTYRWGLLFFVKQASDYLVFYLIFGFAIGILTVISMLWSSSSSE